ncbi:MAG: pantoate--beta-alanine ligase [Deltaproteobacteria bacterium]|nr:pantoate--beta-alanine ligase [Deltaproteobacteria bacterium]
MDLLRSIAETKRRLRAIQAQGLRIGMVPTMGALHDGHLSLVAEAKRRSEVVVASVFVNPKQFGPREDLSRYPRDLEGDAAKLAGAGCDVLFAPAVEEMYPAGFQTEVDVVGVSQGLCGAVRPGHFKGVATVVLKLFSIVRPDVAVFGEKDFQQLTVLRRLARDLSLDVEIVGAPLIREVDGLAMSSRNAYLSPEDRARALALSRGLRAASEMHQRGERGGGALIACVEDELASAGLSAEYVELRALDDLAPLSRAEGPCLILVAARVGSTRLIDNWILTRG